MKHLELKIAERTLANGLTLLAVQNRGVATFAAGVMFDVDVRDEASNEQGLAALLGDCLDEGSKERSSLEIAAALDDLGASLDAHSAGASVHCPAEVARKAVAILTEVVAQPAFPAREVRRVRDEVLQELKTDADDPRIVAGQRFRKAIYGRHPYGRSARGSRRQVGAYEPKDLRRFHKAQFVPERGYVAAAGPDEPKRTLDMLERAFRGLKGDKPARRAVSVPELPEAVSDVHVPMKREQVHVYLGHLGIRREDPDYYALSVMDHILGTGPGFTSRISRKLRDEQGLCYSVDASIARSAREEPGVFAAYIGTSPEHRQRALDGFLSEMRRIQDTLPSAQELADVQEYLTGSFVWQLERNANLARYAIRCKRFDLGFDHLQRYPDIIRGVTRKDIRRVAQERLHPDRVIVVSAGA
ncbi:MAG: pitrilysin family protein [Planctomycetota bacterium]